MEYIIHSLSFVLNNTEHTYLFRREDFLPKGILSKHTFDTVCQYITELTNTTAPSLNTDLSYNTIMRELESYAIPIAYSLATDFTTTNTGWSNQPYNAPTKKEEENG